MGKQSKRRIVPMAGVKVTIDTIDLLCAVADFGRSGVRCTDDEEIAVRDAVFELLNSGGVKTRRSISAFEIIGRFTCDPVDVSMTLLDCIRDGDPICNDGKQWRKAAKILRAAADMIDRRESEYDAAPQPTEVP